jgi:hypothetical protein
MRSRSVNYSNAKFGKREKKEAKDEKEVVTKRQNERKAAN